MPKCRVHCIEHLDSYLQATCNNCKRVWYASSDECLKELQFHIPDKKAPHVSYFVCPVCRKEVDLIYCDICRDAIKEEIET